VFTRGIYLTELENGRVTGNQVVNNVVRGSGLEGIRTSFGDRNLVSANSVTHNGLHVANPNNLDGSGIVIGDDQTTVTGNSVVDNARDGIRVLFGTGGNVVTGNSSVQNDTGPSAAPGFDMHDENDKLRVQHLGREPVHHS